jgi:hypothetical protein
MPLSAQLVVQTACIGPCSTAAGYLKKQEIPMVIVSHDREFLDQLCTKIVETERGVAATFKGKWTGRYSAWIGVPTLSNPASPGNFQKPLLAQPRPAAAAFLIYCCADVC